MKRVIVVGDLQGCAKEARKLLANVNATANDHVVFAGDLIDRGPDNDECIELAIEWEARQGATASILGNHERKHLDYRNKELSGRDPHVQVPSHVATRQQLKPHHYTYMQSMPLYLRLPEHNAAVVHAGVYPGRKIEEQEERHLLHIQMIRPYDKWGNRTNMFKTFWPSRTPTPERNPENFPTDGWRFWTNFWDGPERIIFGHSVLDKALLTEKVCGIDGGCCFGEELRAVILPEWEIVTVPSQTKYSSKRNAATGDNVKLFNVHGDVNTYS